MGSEVVCAWIQHFHGAEMTVKPTPTSSLKFEKGPWFLVRKKDRLWKHETDRPRHSACVSIWHQKGFKTDPGGCIVRFVGGTRSRTESYSLSQAANVLHPNKEFPSFSAKRTAHALNIGSQSEPGGVRRPCVCSRCADLAVVTLATGNDLINTN